MDQDIETSELSELKDRGFGRRIGFGHRPAVIVIDMQCGFTDSSQPLGANLDSQITQINRILRSIDNTEIPAIFTIVEYEEQSLRDAGIWAKKMSGLSSLKAGTPSVALDPRLERQPSHSILLKKYASGFFGTDLVSRLNSRNVDTLIITGCTTSGCVRATAVDAIQSGFIPIVVEEAVSDRLESAHIQSLMDLHLKYADVLPADEVISYLESVDA